MANSKVGMVFFKHLTKCGVQNKNGFEGIVLRKGALSLQFFYEGKEVSYELFLAFCKKQSRIRATFNKYVKQDRFDGSFSVNMDLFKFSFVKDDGMFRLKGGPELAA